MIVIVILIEIPRPQGQDLRAAGRVGPGPSLQDLRPGGTSDLRFGPSARTFGPDLRASPRRLPPGLFYRLDITPALLGDNDNHYH